ncbi:hypothetical protein H6P81_012756 [Aristolochia fimbriata]|uniref:Uncharacterized protein n=1 Tax=Aristolochia fimbriata TaxID=158543 RepID=A0AAV7EHC6_ARIFI|nr:hypothetical protein H6P81_012756 [Aristolochia fimbriata]
MDKKEKGGVDVKSDRLPKRKPTRVPCEPGLESSSRTDPLCTTSPFETSLSFVLSRRGKEWLTWARASSITWGRRREYCRHSNLDFFEAWRMRTIEGIKKGRWPGLPLSGSQFGRFGSWRGIRFRDPLRLTADEVQRNSIPLL